MISGQTIEMFDRVNWPRAWHSLPVRIGNASILRKRILAKAYDSLVITLLLIGIHFKQYFYGVLIEKDEAIKEWLKRCAVAN